MDDFQLLELVEATFSPTRPETLRDGMDRHVGLRTKWRSQFRLDDDEGPYGGQYVWTIASRDEDVLGGHWVPTEDLADIKRA